MPADGNPVDAKTALRAAISRDAVPLTLDQISARNLPAAARSRDITIADHDPARRAAIHRSRLPLDLEPVTGHGRRE